MKKIIGFLLMAILVFIFRQPDTIQAASNFQINGNVLVKYTGNESQVAIPNGVKEIGTNAFTKNTNIRAVYFPESVTTIGTGAFEYCSSLQYVVMTDSIVSIGPLAFRGCDNIQYIELPYRLGSIGSNAFLECGSLTEVTLPAGLYSLEYGVFAGCGKLEAIYVDPQNGNFMSKDGILYSADGKTLLQYPNGKGESVVYVEEGISEIARNAFYGDDKLKQIVLPGSVKTIGIYAFKACTSMLYLELPESVSRIEEHAFAFCSDLEDVNIYNPSIAIGSQVFEECPALILHAEAGSTVEKYASANGIRFQELSSGGNAGKLDETAGNNMGSSRPAEETQAASEGQTTSESQAVSEQQTVSTAEPSEAESEEAEGEKAAETQQAAVGSPKRDSGGSSVWRTVLLTVFVMTAIGSLAGMVLIKRKMKEYE